MRRALISITLLVAACGGSAQPPPDIAVSDLIRQTSQTMTAMQSAAFEMSVDGSPVEIQGLEFVRAEGDYAAPDSAVAELEMRLGRGTVLMTTISIAERTWVTDPLTGEWSELATGVGFNPAIVFGNDGWAPLLQEDLADASLSARGADYLLTGTVGPERVERLTAGLVASQEVEIEITIDADAFHIIEAEFTTSGSEGPTAWHIELGPFDDPVMVDAPETG